MINYRNIQYFLMTEQERSFTRAAKKLFISQQSLSMHISTIEQELGIELFERVTPLQLTYGGSLFLQYAKQVVIQRKNLMKQICDVQQECRGRIRLGISHTGGRYILPKVLPEFKKQYPNIELSIQEGNSAELNKALMEGNVDIIISRSPFLVQGMESIKLYEEEVLLLLPDAILKQFFPQNADAILAEISQSGKIKNLEQCPFLLNKTGNTMRAIANEIFCEEQMQPNILLETENIETLYELCRMQMGVTLYPKLFITDKMESLKKSSIHVISLQYEKGSYSYIAGYRKNSYLSKPEQVLILRTKDELNKIKRDC